MPVRSRIFLLAFLLLFCAVQLGAQPWKPVPDAVAGQVDLVHTDANFVDGRGLSRPQEVAVDTSVVPNRVYVYDVLNNRVLGWRNTASLENGAPADLVLGQPDFFTNRCNTGGISRGSLCSANNGLFFTGLAVDSNGNVYVADVDNLRILEFDSPFTSDTLADRVLVAKDFTSKGCPPDANGNVPLGVPCIPSGLALDRDGNLYVSDLTRGIIVYRQPLATDTVPDGRIISRQECFAPDASSFCGFQGLALDAAGNLYVTDLFLDRVLVFRSPLTTDGVADLVLGQPDFTTVSPCNSPPSGNLPADRLCAPTSVAVDAAGNVWVADYFHQRVLEFDSPLTTDAVPDRVLGKRGSFTSDAHACNGTRPSRDLFCSPRSVAIDSQGALWVAEESNRVVRFNTPLAAGALPDLVLGQVLFNQGMWNLVDARGFLSPQGIVVDPASSPSHVYVADTVNNRVLGWRDARDLAAGRPADLVLGQGGFFSSRCNNAGLSARSLCSPNGLAVDGMGNLYVADTGNNRVLAFDSPFTSDRVADEVFGQGGSFTSALCNNGGVSAGSLCSPFGVAVDRQGNLYVADKTNHRVLLYNQPRRNDTVADKVFGRRGSFQSGGSPEEQPCLVGRDFLCLPQDVAVDAAGNLYVVDTGNRRVLEYNRPVRSGSDTEPDRVFGQNGHFNTSRCGSGKDSLCAPAGIGLAPSGALYVAEGRDSVVVRYPAPLLEARIDRTFRGFAGAGDVAADPAGNLYVADERGNRVLVYQNP